jgi:hypothetical protein
MLANIATIVFLFGMFFVQKDINFALMAFALVVLGLLGEVAANEQESIDNAYASHCHDYAVRMSWVSTGNYVHAIYEEYKYVGYNNNKAHELMQEDIKGFKIGDLYKPFYIKPTLVTRILMTKVGGVQ